MYLYLERIVEKKRVPGATGTETFFYFRADGQRFDAGTRRSSNGMFSPIKSKCQIIAVGDKKWQVLTTDAQWGVARRKTNELDKWMEFLGGLLRPRPSSRVFLSKKKKKIRCGCDAGGRKRSKDIPLAHRGQPTRT